MGESFVIAHGFVVPGAGGAEVGGGDYRRWEVLGRPLVVEVGAATRRG